MILKRFPNRFSSRTLRQPSFFRILSEFSRFASILFHGSLSTGRVEALGLGRRLGPRSNAIAVARASQAKRVKFNGKSAQPQEIMLCS